MPPRRSLPPPRSRWWQRAFDRTRRFWLGAGEQFGQAQLGNQPLRQIYPAGSFWQQGYSVTSSPMVTERSRVNYEKARALYANSLPEYKLGGGFARPIINATAGFMAVPAPTHVEDIVQASDAVAGFFTKEMARLYLGARDCIRDGDAFLRIDYQRDRFSGRRRFHVRAVVPDFVEPIDDPLNGGWRAVEIRYPVTPPAPARPYTILEVLTPSTRRVSIEGEAPEDARERFSGETEDNRWGLIPIVHFKNESGPEAPFGRSDLEPLEPLFRAYHDTILAGIGGIQQFAKPRVQFTLKDVDRFIADNFPEAARTGGQINFQGHEMMFMNEGEAATFLTADPGTAGVVALLELLFYLIVQTSETPEFVMGNAIASSRASAETQMTPFIKHVERKRLAFSEPYQELGSMYLAMARQTGLVPELENYDINLDWPEVTPKDQQSTATAIKTLMDAFVAGVQAGLVSAESAAEFLRPFITTMLPWSMEGNDPDEQARIVAGMQFLELAAAGGGAPTPTAAGAGAGGTPAAPTPAPPLDYAAILARLNGGAA